MLPQKGLKVVQNSCSLANLETYGKRKEANIKSLHKLWGHARSSITSDTYAGLFDDDVEPVSVALNKEALSAFVGKKWANLEISSAEKK